MTKVKPQSKSLTSIAMDNCGDAAQEYTPARTAATSAEFVLGYLKPGMELLDCGCGEGAITVGLAAIVASHELPERIGVAWKAWAVHQGAFVAEAWGEAVGWKT